MYRQTTHAPATRSTRDRTTAPWWGYDRGIRAMDARHVAYQAVGVRNRCHFYQFIWTIFAILSCNSAIVANNSVA